MKYKFSVLEVTMEAWNKMSWTSKLNLQIFALLFPSVVTIKKKDLQ